MKEIIFDGDEIINSTDYEKKADDIIRELGERIFKQLDNYTEKTYNAETGQYEDVKADYRGKKFYKNQIKPLISPSKVTIELNSLLRKYKPFTEAEARTLDTDTYITAFNEYSRVISYISDYLISYMPSKQTFCAFCNITTDIYNTFLYDPSYYTIFKSFEDAFVDINFTLAQVGVVDKSATLAKLQTRDAGHNLVKNPDVVNLSINNIVDKAQVKEKLGKFTAMIEKK